MRLVNSSGGNTVEDGEKVVLSAMEDEYPFLVQSLMEYKLWRVILVTYY